MTSETPNPTIVDSLTASNIILGPTQADVAGYGELLRAVQNDEFIGYSPRLSAELTFMQIDSGDCGTFIDPGSTEDNLDLRSTRRLAQQRYIAGVLGLKVSPTRVDPRSYTASFDVGIPTIDEVPSVPAKDSAGRYIDESGNPLRPIQRDMIFAARFLAQNRDTFQQENAFTRLAHGVAEQAESGRVIVRDKVGDLQGAMSLVRQVARVLGHQVDVFTRTGEGEFTMKVDGIQKGFDAKNTTFKNKGSVVPFERVVPTTPSR